MILAGPAFVVSRRNERSDERMRRDKREWSWVGMRREWTGLYVLERIG